MHDIAVVMITMDRSPRQNYLQDTLLNLRRADVFGSERLHSMTVVDSRPGSWALSVVNSLENFYGILVDVEAPVGAIRTPFQNASTALGIGAVSGAPWVLFLEDDIDVCDKFLDSVGRWLDRHIQTDRHVYAFGASYDIITRLTSMGVTSWDYPIDGFYGTQAIALRAEDAASLSGWLSTRQVDPKSGSYDISMHAWAQTLWPRVSNFLASVPSFVQHVGKDSALSPRTDVHTFASWPGPLWSYRPSSVRA